jgi:formylmethanofuran dehydrogenase subunit D
MGLILERGSDINVGFVYDESEDEFAAIRSIEQGTQVGDITISGYENISANTVKIKGYTANRLTITDADKKVVTSDAGTTAYAEGTIDFDNGRLVLPKGTTAERAVTPTTGEVRLNTDTDKFEAYFPNGGWNYLGIGYGTPVTHQAFTGNGTTYAFTLNKTPSSAEALMVAINGVVQTPGEAYIVAGDELIFIDSTSTAYPVENGAVVDVRHLSSPSVPATRVDTFTGDGSTQTFTLSVGAEDKYGVIVFVDNVYQDPEVYTVSGTSLTFPDGAPAQGDRINVLNYSSIPAPNVITRAEAVDEAITYAIALG